MSGRLSFLSSRLALEDKPKSVPMVSTKSITSTLMITPANPQVKAPCILIFIKIGSMEGGILKSAEGSGTRPVTRNATVMTAMPTSRAPVIFRISRTAVRRRPPRLSSTGSLAILASSTGAPGTPSVTMPMSFSPRKARKRPIPTEKLCLSEEGIASASH